MSVLVRRVDLALWTEPVEGIGPAEVPASVVQHRDFAAKDNALSFWRFDAAAPTWRDDAVLAVVGGWSRLDGVHLVHLDEADLFADRIALVQSAGRTCFAQFQPNHVDAAGLDGYRLAAVAERVAHCARGSQVLSKTREEVLDVLVAAVTRRRMMNVDQLPHALKVEVKTRLASGGA